MELKLPTVMVDDSRSQFHLGGRTRDDDESRALQQKFEQVVEKLNDVVVCMAAYVLPARHDRFDI